MTIGIYCIKNKINNKIYIGQALNIEYRWKTHIYNLNKNTIRCNDYLLNHWKKYGKDNFEFLIIEECLEKDLNERETYWTKYYKSTDRNFGYNIKEAGSNGHHSEETKRKISENHTGINNPFYGKNHSKEHIEKLIEINKKPKSLKQKENISKSHKGKIKSLEHRQNLSKSIKESGSHSGFNNGMYGKHHSNETRLKISENSKKNCKDKHNRSKIKIEDMIEIKQLISQNKQISVIAKMYNVTAKTIYEIKNDKHWTCINAKEAFQKY